MRFDPEETTRQLHAVVAGTLSDVVSVAAAPGVEVEVGPDGDLVGLEFDEAVYEETGTAELGAAIVAAHRAARASALTGTGEAVLAALAGAGLAAPEGWPW